VQFAGALTEFFERRGQWRDWAATQQHAVEAAGRLGDRWSLAHAYRLLGRAGGRLGRYDEADTRLQQALALFDELDDAVAMAATHHCLAWVQTARGDHRRALGHDQQALELYRVAGDSAPACLAGQARALNGIGWSYAQLGDHEHALLRCGQALTLQQRLGDHYGEAHTWDSLGYAHHHLGRHREAVTCYQRALDRYRGLDARHFESDTLTRLGDSQHAVGDHDAARETWQRAVHLLDDLGSPQAGPVQARLSLLAAACEPTVSRQWAGEPARR
jgi:tetratricopeptide (TPR) repeat protein